MIRFSISIQRGCFGGCSFCSITEHEGRIIQNRSEDSVLREIETIRDTVPGFTGVISDLGGPTANMYRIACKSREIEAACRLPSCVFPRYLRKPQHRPHAADRSVSQGARALPGVKKILIASGVRYDLAIESPEYVKELAQHHVGGYLKIAPEHVREGPLSKMMKPGVGTYYRFKELFDRYSKEAGKEQYLIPYFIAAHPGTTDEDMLELAIWLKTNGFRADQVQAFLPSPMALATAMYYSGKNPLRRVTRDSENVRGGQGPAPAPPAQGLPALSRSQQLAGAARGLAPHGPRQSHRQRPEAPDSRVPAARHWPGRGRKSPCARSATPRVAAAPGSAHAHATHGIAARAFASTACSQASRQASCATQWQVRW